MTLRRAIFQFVYRQLLERPARGQSFDALIQALETQGRALSMRLADMPDTSENREQVSHIIGIERWGQRRLETLLGQPLIHDEYDGYRPDKNLGWRQLQDAFVETRAASIALARRLQRSSITTMVTVLHNDAGQVTAGGWLYYFVQHAASESKRIR